MPKRSYHHGNLRSALIAAGLRAIAEHGPDGFSLRDVARRAGVSAAAPYRHFADKDALLAAIAIESLERLRGTIDAALVGAPADPLQRFRATGVAYVRFAAAHPEHFRALCTPGMTRHIPPELVAQAAADQAAERAGLAAGQLAGTIASEPLDDLMLAAHAIVHGLAHYIVQGELGKVDAERAGELATIVTGLLGTGLYPRSTTAPSTRPTTAARPRRRART